jgi:3-hydroxyisobutyrate dehydrogenase-like beta-hydroxyacid dehydrogenase
VITLIGLGPMGQAMVRAFVKEGHDVTVWNRTASRAEGLGATIAPTVADALAANELVILSLTDYQAMYDVLDKQSLQGKVIVNLSSDTPAKTLQAAAWAAEHGAKFVDGGVMVPEHLVATDVSYVFYSGPQDVVRAHEEVLRIIGRVDYVGEQPGLAQLHYQAQLTIFLTSLSSLLHATALLKASGVPAEKFARYAKETFDTMSIYVDEAAQNVDTHTYPGDGANVIMMGATADHIVGASDEAGLDLELPNAVKSLYDRAIAKGHGKSGWPSLYEVIAP